MHREEGIMELIIRQRHDRLGEHHHTYLESRLNRLGRYMDTLEHATVELTEERRSHEGVVHRMQITLRGAHGVLLRAERHHADLRALIDDVADVLQRQITHYKERHWRRGRLRRRGDEIVETDVAPTMSEPPMLRQITRTKVFAVTPMYSDEAIEQMELLGHDFFVFRDADNDEIAVVYRRRDGQYGLLMPRLEMP